MTKGLFDSQQGQETQIDHTAVESAQPDTEMNTGGSFSSDKTSGD